MRAVFALLEVRGEKLEVRNGSTHLGRAVFY